MLVTIDEEATQRYSKLIVVDNATKDFRIGRIEALGPEVNAPLCAGGIAPKPHTHHLKVGDNVVLNTYHGFKINVGGKKMILMPSDAVFATFTPAE